MLDLLFPGSDGAIHSQPPPPGLRPAHAFLALPLRGAPRLLLPCGPGVTRRATATSFRQRNEGIRNAAARAARTAAAFALRVGAVQLVLVPPRVDVALPAAGDTDDYSLVDHLSRVLGRTVVIGGTVKPRDVHQTQTLHALTPGGAVVGFVKVSWNALTNSLLRNEVRTLQGWPHHPGQQVMPPPVLHFGSWQGRDVVVTGPLPVPGRNTSSRLLPPPAAVTLEVASTGPRRDLPLIESDYWTRSLQRVAQVRAAALEGGPLDPAVDGLLDDLIAHFSDSWQDVPLPFGAWHGDWLPWNFVRDPVSGRLLVWDWEYSTDCAPLGFDLLHFYYGMRFFARGLDAATSLRQATIAAEPLLPELGVERRVVRLVGELYGFETLLRRLEISVQHGGVDDARVFPSLPDALRRTFTERGPSARRSSAAGLAPDPISLRYTSAQIPSAGEKRPDHGNGEHPDYLSRTHARGEMPD